MTAQAPRPAPRPLFADAPTELIVGALLSVVVGAAFALAQTYARGFDHETWLTRWTGLSMQLAWRGLGPAVTALAIAGVLDLARRSIPREARLLRIGAGALGVLLMLPFVMLYAEHAAKGAGTMTDFYAWRGRVQCAAALLASAMVIAAGWRQPSVRAAALPLLVVTVLVFPTVWLYHELHFATRREPSLDRWLQLLLDRGLHAGFWAALLSCADAIGRAAPPQPRWHRAGAGLHRAGSALLARLIIAVASSGAIVVALVGRSGALIELWTWLFPASLLIANVVLVASLLQAGSLGADGAPRVRLHVAAALVGWGAAIQAFQAAGYFRSIALPGASDNLAVALPYLAPAIALAGLLCALSAAFALRGRLIVEVAADEASIITAAVMAGVGSVGTAILYRWLWDGVSSLGSLYLLMIGLAVAAVIGQIAVARVLHRLGAAMQQVPELPVATVR